MRRWKRTFRRQSKAGNLGGSEGRFWKSILLKLLLHACCGPCSLEPTRILAEEGADITIAYVNSNIHPAEEYSRRCDTLKTFAATQGYGVLEGNYNPDLWEREVGVYGANRTQRCRACYRMRFREVAQMAAEGGYEAIATTLSVSPYQFIDAIGEELAMAAKEAGVGVVFKDFRENYPEATRRSRELGMYRQNFCGCHYSDSEAQKERAERKEARRVAKAAKESARAENDNSK